nr:reverse transcriptase domain-containing protein [Tanacetum cinerariifolium]
MSNQTNKIKNMMASLFQMNTASTSGSRSLPSNTVANPKGKLKAITTRSGIVLDGPTVPAPSLFINPKEDERVEETLTDPNLSEYTIKMAISNASLVFEDFDPPLYELPFFKEVPSIPRNLKTHTEGFCPPVFISSTLLENHDIDSSLKDSIDQSNLSNPTDNFDDSMPEMFADKHALDYSSPPIFDEYDDDFLELESDIENVYDDPFDSKGEKIKESKLLIDELDLPCDFLPSFEYDSFISQDFPGLMLSHQPTTRTRY